MNWNKPNTKFDTAPSTVQLDNGVDTLVEEITVKKVL